MNSFVIVLLALALKPPLGVSTVKNVDKFDKYVDFLCDFISGEVMVLQNSTNEQLANTIIDKINQKEQVGLITVVDVKTLKDVRNEANMNCPRCNWFVTLHENNEKNFKIPLVIQHNLRHNLWSTSSNYIIIVTNPINLDELNIYRHIYYMKTIKLIILFKDVIDGQIRMIRPEIFVSKKMVKVNIGDDLSNVFAKQLKNLQGFPLKTAYIEDPVRLYEVDGRFGGMDGEYFNTILTALNASFDVTDKIPKVQQQLLEGYYASGQVDINFNTNFQRTLSETKYIEPLYPRNILEIRVLVPKAGLVSSLYLFLQPFSSYVWIAAIVVFVLLGWGWYRLNRRYSKKKLTRTDIGLQLTRMQITQNFNLASIIVPLRFKKVFVIGFIFWSFVLSQAYQSVMIANLLEPFSYPEINTIKQLNMSGLNVITSNFYYKLSKSTTPFKLSNLHVNHTAYEMALQHDFEPNTAYVMPETDALTVIYSEKNIKNGRPIMHLMQEVVAFAPQSYSIFKKLPIKKEIEDIMGRIKASGIDQYWRTLTYGRAEIRYKRKLALAANPTLGMDQIRYAFYVLIAGHSLAFVVFIFELIWAKVQRFLNAYFRPIIRH